MVIAGFSLLLVTLGWPTSRSGAATSPVTTRDLPPSSHSDDHRREVSLNQHLGRHNVLLYFNEGMG
jgi:hypothetical protein